MACLFSGIGFLLDHRTIMRRMAIAEWDIYGDPGWRARGCARPNDLTGRTRRFTPRRSDPGRGRAGAVGGARLLSGSSRPRATPRAR
jgi:hypothetical protein